MILDISSMTILDKVQAPLSQSQISAIDSVVSGNYQPVGDYIIPTDIAIEYHDDIIWLSSKSYVTSVDCADFIKDGMLSTVELCDTTLILNFNTDAGSDPISIELSNFVDNYDTKIDYLSNCISINVEKLKRNITRSEISAGFTEWDINATGTSYDGTDLKILWDGMNWCLYSNGNFIDPPEPSSGQNVISLDFAIQGVTATRIQIPTMEDLSLLSSKQDNLTNDQLFALDTSVNDRQTTLDFGNGDVSAFNWSGTINLGTMVNAGLYDSSLTHWLKMPISVKIGTAVTQLGNGTFSQCNALTNILLHNNITYIGNNALHGSNISNIVIPSMVEYIGNYAFCNCKLSNITIPDNVKTIGEFAFNNTNINQIIIPNSVISVGKNAFVIPNVDPDPSNNPVLSIIVEGKTQEEAEVLLSGSYVTSRDKIITYARNTDTVSKNELKQILSSVTSDPTLSSIELISDFANMVSSIVKIRDILSSLYIAMN